MIAFLTYVYSDTAQTAEFYNSCNRHGINIMNICPYRGEYKGAHAAIKDVVSFLNQLPDCYTHALIVDGGDSVFQAKPTMVPDHILYQGEKNCYPHPSLAEKHPQSTTEWRYLNGGCISGSVENMRQFYSLVQSKFNNTVENGQHAQQLAFFEWVDSGKKAEIDSNCQLSQSIAFSENFQDFEIDGKVVKNKVTRTIPYILHGNGRTNMEWIYNLYK